jgi:hypothetical protein
VTDGPLTRLARALLLAGAAVVLVALVAVSAGGYRLGDSSAARSSPYAVDTILTVVIALYVIAAAAVIVAMFWSGLELRRFQSQGTRRRRTTRSVLIVVGAVVLITAVAARVHLHPRFATERSDRGAKGAQTQKRQASSRQPASQQARIRLVPLFAVLGLAGVGVAAFLVAEKRRRRRLPRDWAVAEALADVLEETLDDLRAEPDPRRAVIGAYARMERSLAAHGIPRYRFEAPHEYLGRVFGELTAGRLSAMRLTALFERARFSPHEIDQTMKAAAIDAIEALQADLAVAEAEAA